MHFNWWKKKKQDNVFPSFWREYLSHFDHKVDRNLGIGDIQFIVLDTETSGLNVKKDFILSIGAVSLHNWEIDLNNSFEQYIAQSYNPADESIAVHGILPVVKEGYATEIQSLESLLFFLKNKIIVGHHIGFDIAMLNQTLNRHQLGKLKNMVLDTGQLARRLAPSTEIHKHDAFGLDQLCKQYNIPMNDRHTALGDAFLTAMLFLKLLYRLEKRGVRDLKGLLRSF